MCLKSPETGESGYKQVVQTFENETTELVTVTYEDEEIVATPIHPFYVPQKGWTEAINLRAGDILVTSNGEYVVVEQIQHEILETPVTVYNFEVEDYHTYYVSANADSTAASVLVHNMCAKKADIKQVESAAKELKMDPVTRREFGDFIESLKKGIPNNKNFSYKDLLRLGKEFLDN